MNCTQQTDKRKSSIAPQKRKQAKNRFIRVKCLLRNAASAEETPKQEHAKKLILCEEPTKKMFSTRKVGRWGRNECCFLFTCIQIHRRNICRSSKYPCDSFLRSFDCDCEGCDKELPQMFLETSILSMRVRFKDQVGIEMTLVIQLLLRDNWNWSCCCIDSTGGPSCEIIELCNNRIKCLVPSKAHCYLEQIKYWNKYAFNFSINTYKIFIVTWNFCVFVVEWKQDFDDDNARRMRRGRIHFLKLHTTNFMAAYFDKNMASFRLDGGTRWEWDCQP